MSPVLGCILLLFGVAICYGQDDPEVDISYGTVRGRAIQLSSGAVINAYMGVPYAKPPIGDLRFESPVEPDPWETPLEAFEPGNACIQASTTAVDITHNGWTKYSEDCLHVNIYSPQAASGLPVMVYIHGGGFQVGANFVAPGYFMAEQDVVFVSVNYRLGILGFAYTGDDTIPGNVGLLDMIQALTFIQENIAAFGGDPTRVTISGQSAGGAAVGLLLMSPLAEGLFHGAIPQSGTEFVPWSYLEPETNPEKYLVSIAQQFDCPIDSSQQIVDCLRTVDVDDLIQASFNCTLGYVCVGFQPVVDGLVLPDTPLNLRNSGNYIKVPEMIGLTEDESYLTIFYLYPGLVTDEGLNRTDFDDILYSEISYSLQKLPSMERVDDVYQAFRFHYTEWASFDDPIKNRDMLSRVSTDKEFGYGVDIQAKLHSTDGSDVFFYVYDYRVSYASLPEWMGAVHGTELGLQFGWPFLEDNNDTVLHSQLNPVTGIPISSSLDKEMSAFFMTLWANFAKTGNPTPEPVSGPDNTLVNWSKFLAGDNQLNYLLIKDSPEVLLNYRQKDYSFWTQYVNYLMYGIEF